MEDMLGKRIENARKEKSWKRSDLAEKMYCSEKSIIRYEKSESLPAADMLVRLALILNTSADYLLGLSEKKQPQGKQQEVIENINIILCNEPDEKEEYYWIEYSENLKGACFEGGQTKFVEFTDTFPKKELRILRPCNAKVCVKLCTMIHGKPMVVNTSEELYYYLLIGGHAIIKAELVREYLPRLLEPFVCEATT